jgi:tetratricopeptide (TPR) repeat protein
MALYFCDHCRLAVLPEDATTDGKQLFCKKCAGPLSNLGSENSQISLRAHIESKDSISSKELYHSINKIRSKHYRTLKKNPIWIDCESKLIQNPKNTDALFTLSQLTYAEGHINEAIAIAEKIITINPNHEGANEFLSRRSQGTALPDTLTPLEKMAKNYIQSKNYEHARNALKKILSIDPKHPAAHRHMADICIQTEDFKNAITHLNRLAMIYPDDDSILFNLAVACYMANDIDRAKSNLKAAHTKCTTPELLKEINEFMGHLSSL